MAGSTTPGGVAKVIEAYQRAGLFRQWPIRFLCTHADYGHHPARKIWQAVRSLAQYCGWLLRGQVTLLHAHTSVRGSFWRKFVFAAVTRWFRRPVIVHLHSGEILKFYDEECGPIGRSAFRQFLDRADRIVVLSETWKRELARLTRNQAIVVIPNPVLVGARESSIPARQPCQVLFMGRLVESKGVFVLLDAIAALAAEFPDVQLVCAGTGDAARVHDCAVSLGIGSRVSLPGWVDGADKARLLANCSAFVLPSLAEGLPVSVMEAMAAGSPIVATSVGGVPDIITDNKEGLLVPPGKAAPLARALATLLRDPDRAARMAGKARARAERQFSAPVVLSQVGDLYRGLGQFERDEQA